MEKVDSYRPVDSNDRTVLILRAFHSHLPTDGKANFLQHLQSLETNQQLYDHAKSLMDGLIVPLRYMRSTPSISPRLGMEDSIDNVASESTVTGPMVRESRLKSECLARDGNRCVVTGAFDEDTLDPTTTIANSTFTECAHIIPFALSSWHSESEEYAKNIIWTNLVRHFPVISSVNFSRENINDARNAMTMSTQMHRHSGRFDFAFEATTQPNRYRMKYYRPNMIPRFPRTVTFSSYDQRYELPSPELLRVHAIIARIFHASGAAEPTEKALRDLGGHRMLARDGSTDISAMLSATSLGVLSSRAGNVQQPRTESPEKVTSKLERLPGEDDIAEQNDFWPF